MAFIFELLKLAYLCTCRLTMVIITTAIITMHYTLSYFTIIITTTSNKNMFIIFFFICIHYISWLDTNTITANFFLHDMLIEHVAIIVIIVAVADVAITILSLSALCH